MTATTDWHDWHSPYADDTSALSRRLRLVQRHIGDWLDERPESSLRIVSVCAGQGNDLVGVLARRSDADRVRAELIEKDSRNVAAARGGAAAAGLGGITVTCADAGDCAAYRAAVPADLVLLAGVLGNISDQDVQATITAMPPGFSERTSNTPPDVPFSVGVPLFTGSPGAHLRAAGSSPSCGEDDSPPSRPLTSDIDGHTSGAAQCPRQIRAFSLHIRSTARWRSPWRRDPATANRSVRRRAAMPASQSPRAHGLPDR